MNYLKDYLWATIKEVVRPPQGILPYHFIIPSRPGKEKDRQKGFYLQQYDWDLYFEGLCFSQVAPEKMIYFKEALLNFLHFTTPSGKTPRTISPYRFWDPYDQHKPFLVQGVLLAAKSLNDFSWITEQIWAKLNAFISFWENRQGFHGLIRWRSVLESGVDNNPTIANLKDLSAESVDASTYLYQEYLAMAELAHNLNKDSQVWYFKAENLKKRINKIFWDQKDRIYYDVLNFSDKDVFRIKVRSWTCFTPLWAGIPSFSRARAMIETYLLNEKEFLSPYGLRSLSKSELLYNNAKRGMIYIHSEKRRWIVSNWQGPVWVVANWILTQGLKKYGYKKEADKIIKRVVATLENDIKETKTLHENYDSETGKGLWAPDFGSWNLLALIWKNQT